MGKQFEKLIQFSMFLYIYIYFSFLKEGSEFTGKKID